MEKKYFYFQPQYVEKFKCDGSKCNARCCQGWNIFVDAETFKQYSQEMITHMKFDSDREEYLLTLDEKRRCPFLNEKNLCRIQLKFGEKFLSRTCATYPRITSYFGYFFERSLILSCPLAAEIILFEREPMKFEFVQVPEKIHSPGGKLAMQTIQATDELTERIIEIQIAMISILQERTLSIDQRLIVLGFFIDKLEEIFSNFDEDALIKLIAAYESKNFLAEEVPLMIQSVSFDAEKFKRLLCDLAEKVFDDEPKDGKYLADNVETFALADKKIFHAEYSTFLENYLVNELFSNIFPYKFEGSPIQNYFAYVAEYKLFEATIFSARNKNSDDRKNLLELTNWFTMRFGHTKEYQKKIFECFADNNEPFALMESLLEGGD